MMFKSSFMNVITIISKSQIFKDMKRKEILYFQKLFNVLHIFGKTLEMIKLSLEWISVFMFFILENMSFQMSLLKNNKNLEHKINLIDNIFKIFKIYEFL